MFMVYAVAAELYDTVVLGAISEIGVKEAKKFQIDGGTPRSAKGVL